MDLQPGQRLGHYSILDLIGRGGMGAVYRATDTRLDREVAIKVLPAEVMGDPERRQRFHQEAQLAASFNHPNIATVYDVGEQDGVTFIVMELVRGKSLRELVGGKPLGLEAAVEISVGVAAALARAHGAGVLHRDLKPDNVVLTDDGMPKILDFGLGKLIGESEEDEGPAPGLTGLSTRTSPHFTRAGQLVGTLAYMAPEQIQGGPVDARADVFAFGVLLFEMLAGERPFKGRSNLDTVTAILRDSPEPLADLRQDVPEDLARILARSLEKEPARRFASGKELYESLLAVKRRLDTPRLDLGSLSRRPGLIAAAVLLVALAGGGLGWILHRSARISWARNEALPEIERLFSAGDRDGAMRLLNEASEIIPDDPYLTEYFNAISIPLSLDTDPSGATVYVKGYDYPEREWIRLGTTPLEAVPVGFPNRFRIEKEGYASFEGAPFGLAEPIRLFPPDEIPPGMVYVPAGTASFGSADPTSLDEFWIDKYEVTNELYKAFVDDGGYRDRRFWEEGVDPGAFVDTTGRPGPSGWSLASYPEGQGQHPVSGVSWFEASAYAAWAGKSLPTVFHWFHAARQSIFSEILRWSNFDSQGPASVGAYAGLGPYGTYDMAGNIREWCINRIEDQRYILGGAWSDPDYLYRSSDTADPWDRARINGFRTMLTKTELPAASLVEIDYQDYDHRRDKPVDEAVFALVRQSYDYDARDLDAKVESRDHRPSDWIHEVFSVRTPYGDERMPIHLYLPKDAAPPYQTVIYFPPSSALHLRDSSRPSFPLAYFIPKAGRALIYPIYQGTYDRRIDVSGPNGDRDWKIQMGQDLRRTVDFIDSRDDLADDKIAFYGLSWGAALGPIMTAIEPRFAASVLLAGGLHHYPDDWPPAAVPQNFSPRVTVPTLMINGKKDFGSKVETEIQPMFDGLGTPDEHKRLALFDGGHVPASSNELIREILDWLDRYLGPVEGAG